MKKNKWSWKIIEIALIPIVTALILNFIITWHSAPQLSMNISGDRVFFPGRLSTIERRIEIENEGDSVIGARVLIDVPEEYIISGDVATKLISKTNVINKDIKYKRYQVDIDAPIIHDRSMGIGTIWFKIKDKNTEYRIPFEIYATKMAKRKGEILVNVSENNEVGFSSRSSRGKREIKLLLLGRQR